MTTGQWLEAAKQKLSKNTTSSPQLDAQLLLCHVLQVNKTWLIAHPNRSILNNMLVKLDELMKRRTAGEPMAYILGRKEFYGRSFTVTSAVLIPRPESEQLIDDLKNILEHKDSHSKEAPWNVVDVGAGSGCLGITAKLEVPEAVVTLCDVSQATLDVARKNADALGADVQIVKSDLLGSIGGQPDIIIANLPYVHTTWQRSAETDYEPPLALFADDHGLGLIKQLIVQAQHKLAPPCWLLLEADPRQHTKITQFAKLRSFETSVTSNFTLRLKLL